MSYIEKKVLLYCPNCRRAELPRPPDPENTDDIACTSCGDVIDRVAYDSMLEKQIKKDTEIHEKNVTRKRIQELNKTIRRGFEIKL